MDDYGERTENFEVLLDGQPTDYAQYMSLFYNGQTNWGMGIYFDRIPNGTHQIQLVSTLHLNDEVDDEAIFLVLSNRAQSITVDNQITFTNWDDTIWNNTNYTFRAQSKNPDTDWWIDIFDAWGNWVNGAAGHTTNGQIEWTWDLTDYDGNLRDSLENDPFFDPWITFNLATANGSAGANSQASRPTPVTLVPYPVQGEWMISCQNEFYTSGSAGHDYMFEAMGAIQGWVDYRDVPTLFYPVVYGTNGTTQADRDDSWETLKLILARGGDFRNFYYFGHGNSNSIGGDLNDYDTNGVVVGCRDLPGSKAHLYSRTAHDEITHNLSTGVHQFRFVWLDGCNTALGNWPDFAFDVNKATNTLSYYTSTNTNPRHLRQSAFVGWATKPGGGNQWGHVDDYFFYRSEWIREWSYNALTKSLHDALNDAVADSNWPPGREIQLWNGLRTYGYIALKMNEYNQKNDWPHP